MTKHLFATILDAFRHNAEGRPDHIAIVYENTRLTYGQVDELSDNLAAYIQGRIPPKSVVGIMLGRNENMMVAPLGVLKAGCAYLPLDPSYPPERLQFMMKDADARMLIADEDLLPVLKETEAPSSKRPTSGNCTPESPKAPRRPTTFSSSCTPAAPPARPRDACSPIRMYTCSAAVTKTTWALRKIPA